MPDFGYGHDNYLLQDASGTSKWSLLLGLLGDKKKFGWLINYITCQKLEAQLQAAEEQERQARIKKQMVRFEMQ